MAINLIPNEPATMTQVVACELPPLKQEGGTSSMSI